MPKVIPYPVALRADLKDQVKEVFILAQRLESVIAVKSRGSSEVFHGKVDHSQPPWNAPVAGLIMELHAWTRFTERLWRRTAGLPVRDRGGGHRNTWKALEALTGLSEAVDDGLVAEDKRWLASWSRRARIVLGEEESMKRLPRNVGSREPKCPWCKKTSLRQLALEGSVFCIDPKCKDEEGRRPKAYLEMFHGEWVMRWQDGVLGSP
jgi:hypothetical protein